MDAALEEAAQTSGSGNFGTLLRITVPILSPAILASTALGFVKSLESFEVELVLGVPAGIYVLPTKIYDFVHMVPPQYGEATALCIIFLIAVFLMITLQRRLLSGREFTTITGRGYTRRVSKLGGWRWLIFTFCLMFILITIFLPLATLLTGTFMNVFGFFALKDPWTTRHWLNTFNDRLFLSSVINTMILGLTASVVGMVFYTLVSYFQTRTQFRGRGLIELLCWIPWALPGILLGLGLLWAVLGSGAVIKLLYGTVFLLVLAIIIKETPVGTQITKAGIMHVSKELEEAATVSGASSFLAFKDIVLPLLRPALVAVAIIVFIAAVREIPTVVLLATHEQRTISLLMLDYTTEGEFERAAVLGVFIVLLIIVILLVSRALGLRALVEKD
jgi:iron(III) transport system permease protein